MSYMLRGDASVQQELCSCPTNRVSACVPCVHPQPLRHSVSNPRRTCTLLAAAHVQTSLQSIPHRHGQDAIPPKSQQTGTQPKTTQPFKTPPQHTAVVELGTHLVCCIPNTLPQQHSAPQGSAVPQELANAAAATMLPAAAAGQSPLLPV
jgi:hypothetical protein